MTDASLATRPAKLEAIESWRVWIEKRVADPPERRAQALAAAMRAMTANKTQDEIAAAALDAAQRWRPPEEPASIAAKQWRAWAQGAFGGPEERIEAIAGAALSATRSGATRDVALEAARAAGAAWASPARTQQEERQELHAAAFRPALVDWAARVAVGGAIVVAIVAALVLRHFTVAALLALLLIIRPRALHLDETPRPVLVLLWLLVPFGIPARQYAYLLRGDPDLWQPMSILVFALGVAFAGTRFLRIRAGRREEADEAQPGQASAARAARAPRQFWFRRKVKAAPDSPPSGPVDPATIPAEQKGVVCGLMYRTAPIMAWGRGRAPPRMYNSVVCTFAVRRQGLNPQGRPLPAISVQLQGWKLEGLLDEGDVVAFRSPVRDYVVANPGMVYNVTRAQWVTMLRVKNDPAYRRIVYWEKAKFWISLSVFLVFGVIALAFVASR